MVKRILSILMFFSLVFTCFPQQTIELNNWKFTKGDNPEWSQPGFDDSAWESIRAGSYWEYQGYKDYNGNAWYRIRFNLPKSMRNQAVMDSLLFSLGKIDDCDQTFLNGKLLGQNSITVKDENTRLPQDPWDYKWARSVPRYYAIPGNDPRLMWDKENTLAIRVYDWFGMGGLYTSPVNIRMKNATDYLLIDSETSPLIIRPKEMLSKTVFITNRSSFSAISGKLVITLTNPETSQTIIQKTYPVNLGKGEKKPFILEYKYDQALRTKLCCEFTETGTNFNLRRVMDMPFLLTPKPSRIPQINGPKVVGVGKGSGFIYRIPTTGYRPVSFSAKDLPAGLSLDVKSGIITGSINETGEYIVKVQASNKYGTTVRDLKIVVGGRLALTPPMGWNSWNGLGYDVSQEKVQQTADILVSSGLADHGYRYVNTDIGWEPMQRALEGPVVPNEKFPDMKGLTQYIHSYGLQAGIYISAGPKACSVNRTELGVGSFGHNESDAQTFANWGFDYLKYDWCSYSAKDDSKEERKKPYEKMRLALNATNHDFVYSLSGPNASEWGGSVGGNLWRVVDDIEDNWQSVVKGFNLDAIARYAGQGNWNDPDMLVIGWGWYGDNVERLHPTHLTPDEQYTHISLWSLLSAPLLIGSDLTKLDDFTLNLLSNDEVIAINQDTLAKQAIAVAKTNDYQIMVKDLDDGSKAIGLFNLTESKLKLSVAWDAIKLNGKQKVRDVWRQKDLGVFADKFESLVQPHGVVLVKTCK